MQPAQLRTVRKYIFNDCDARRRWRWRRRRRRRRTSAKIHDFHVRVRGRSIGVSLTHKQISMRRCVSCHRGRWWRWRRWLRMRRAFWIVASRARAIGECLRNFARGHRHCCRHKVKDIDDDDHVDRNSNCQNNYYDSFFSRFLLSSISQHITIPFGCVSLGSIVS